ncbi:uroporphyrinogen-III C-methyltransferase [Marinomonas mediterranea]|jgi:uroporphyrinogen-III C-methyltransferase (EC 2.1.1.107)/precorrin-2 dehydrogenase (EC 1.3.1.76)|uniref:uroporphyrinogen-III C-methyltransferase n=1 Tax=Marinomonas mediterranea (strain ATCC 700492 / JCM 21426 / NBRC 103028 / MMB-1) TaxID=717774 RepID=F2JWF2_MARM1|nr:uroporphyrinogen-III C-methyltransferase [Marinomonas mediterranea]ADZ90625.1 uroporphyrin-III C-methyltransferase [Marinomonas mediterranea MMB-1]WCN08667.1 uroporphyrinogen-III C-methyltransferase [Marinomonas mediterranea]WCN12722.1 uroporphyrinogen-III C-methyltransferase [Marinomonas mediterranea]WCN16795.1 uroporphyrinogen-III C-methyltransferase [Marinomonas mediterranea MMB-1]
MSGKVYLIGAGPGDPDLLTIKAHRLLSQADVVLYDRLVGEQIIDMIPENAEKLYVGKAKSLHTLPQEDINVLLGEKAKEGKTVVRLKGGDPFIFGRGGEELEELVEEGIPFEVVPGVTAAAGCAAYAGIPLTHRDYAQSVRFLTGHLKDGTTELPWDELVHPSQTLVIYMGLTGIESISQALIRFGMPPSMPVAVVEKGTTKDQRVFTSTIKSISGVVKDNDVKSPALLIIGEVVMLQEKLAWYGRD